MFSSRYASGVRKHKKTILSYRMGQKLRSKLLFISLPYIDGLYMILPLLNPANNFQ